MDRISELPDALLLRILSLLPTAKHVVATMVLSKRWQFLWMMVPKLVYDDNYQNPEYGRFSRFVDRSLFMHEAPVETLHFRLGRICGSGDIQVWIRAAHKCCVRELIIQIITYPCSKSSVTLPRSLYTCCRRLVTLKLSNGILVDGFSSSISFPSLRKLSLISMKYPSDEFVNRLLSNCPVLEDLVVKRCDDDNVTIFNIVVSSLKSLVLSESWDIFVAATHGFVIDTPSLELLDVFDDTGGVFIVSSNMPKIVEAKVVISYADPRKILSSITSVKCLSLCAPTSMDAYPVGSVFCCLVNLKMCTCETEWVKLFVHMLKNSPKLRALRFEKCRGPEAVVPCLPWIEPSSVPECLLSSLETVEWVKYKGTEEEKEVVAFILRSGSCLKKVTISPESSSSRKKLRMIKELSFSPRRSPACRLAFD